MELRDLLAEVDKLMRGTEVQLIGSPLNFGVEMSFSSSVSIQILFSSSVSVLFYQFWSSFVVFLFSFNSNVVYFFSLDLVIICEG